MDFVQISWDKQRSKLFDNAFLNDMKNITEEVYNTHFHVYREQLFEEIHQKQQQ